MTATLEKEVTAPQPPLDGDVADRRSKFRKLTAETPRDPSAERAFLASKLAVLQSHPKLSAATRYEGEQTLAEAAGWRIAPSWPQR